MAAKAVAIATIMRMTAGMYVRTLLRVPPRSGVRTADAQPIEVAEASPYLTSSVAEKDVNAYDEKKLFFSWKAGKL